MRRALEELQVGTWFTGLRRGQSSTRTQTSIVQRRDERYKISPIVDWTDCDIWEYMKHHESALSPALGTGLRFNR